MTDQPITPTDKELLAAMQNAINAFPPNHPRAANMTIQQYETELQLRKGRAILARWGNTSSPTSWRGRSMTELSHAAQAVLDGANRAYDQAATVAQGTAAALRAAVLHAQPKAHIESIDYVHQLYVDGWKDALGIIHDIANELEGQG